jgi:hypothetical protein
MVVSKIANFSVVAGIGVVRGDDGSRPSALETGLRSGHGSVDRSVSSQPSRR